MLKDLLNKEVVITYALGYSYAHKRGVITKVTTDFLILDNHIYIAVKTIIKIVLKDHK